jgi:iron-sulfur cluster assembly protein
MAVTLSESAAKEIHKIMTDQAMEPETCIRIGVQGGGCSGFSYSLNWDKETSDRDRVAEFHGVKLVIDKKFDPYLDGTVIDFYEGLDRRGFVFNNPNVVKTCGCGSSFQV